MGASRLGTLITFILGLITCVAAVIVVPEVRCAVGLKSNLPEGCRRDPPRAVAIDNLMPPSLPAPTAPSMRPDVAASVARIAKLFQAVEHERATGQLDSIRREITGFPGDSAYATIYFARGDVPKIRARAYSGDVRTSFQAYYGGGQLAFIYRTTNRLFAADSVELEQQRFYFSGGSLIRWLDANHREVSPTSAEYIDAEQRMRSLGTRLMDAVRSADGVIAF
ncbi:MAG TPA: hypothetical protein VF541_15850 [Longimicrobium sp.]|jgi:hypothetical protein